MFSKRKKKQVIPKKIHSMAPIKYLSDIGGVWCVYDDKGLSTSLRS